MIKNLLENNDIKLTEQRKIIVHQLLLADRHLCVKDLYQKVKQYNVGLATVYRTVKLFQEIGLQRKL